MKTKKMNYVLVPLSLVALLTFCLIGGHAFAGSLDDDADGMTMSAFSGVDCNERGFDRRGMRDGAQHLNMLAVALDFSDEQKAQVKAMASANRDKMQTMRQQQRQGQQQLRQMMDSENFDEQAFRLAAGKVAATKVDMMVMRAQHRQAVFAVMTPEQREKAKNLKQAMGPKRCGKKGGKKGGKGGQRFAR